MNISDNEAIAREAWGTWAMLLTKRLANRFEFQRIVREAIDKATEQAYRAAIKVMSMKHPESRAAPPQEWTACKHCKQFDRSSIEILDSNSYSVGSAKDWDSAKTIVAAH